VGLDRGEPASSLDAISPRGCQDAFGFAIRCNSLVVGTRLCIRDHLVGLGIDRSLRLGGRLPSADPRVDRQLKSVTVSTHL
jgi:hypothetical protein